MNATIQTALNNIFKTIAQIKPDGYQKFFSSLPNPNLMFASVGDRQATLENISMDPHVASCIQSRKSGVLSQLWEVQPQKDNTDEIYDFIQQCFNKLNLFKIISDILDAPLYGFQVLEITWQPEIYNGRYVVVPKNIQSKPHKWFYFDSNQILRLKSSFNKEDKILPPYKFIIVQYNPSFENPYGEAILSKCLWPVVFKKVIVTFWARFAEKFGMPHFLGKIDPIASQQDYEKFLDVLDGLIQDGSAVISQNESVEILSGVSGGSSEVYLNFINFCNTEISKAILSQTLTTELGEVGSYAASKVHFEIRDDIIKRDRLMVESALNQLIRWSINLNFGPQTEYPKFVIFQEEDVDQPTVDVIVKLKNAGIQVTEDFLIRRLGLRKNEFKFVDQTPQLPIESITGFAENTTAEPEDQKIIDKQIEDTAAQDLGLDEIVNQVVQFLEQQEDFETTIQKIYKLFPKIKTQKFEEELTKKLFAAQLLGRLSVQLDLGEIK